MKNRIYFFTGTGNSLKVAKDIAKALIDCEIVAIHKGMNMEIPKGYQRIGFVFPVYYFGLPDMVVKFVRQANFSSENAGYYFAVATPGGFSGRPLNQIERLLSEKGAHLNYGMKIRMNANYIIRYGSIRLYYATAMKGYNKRIAKIVSDIKNNKSNKIEKYSSSYEKKYLENIYKVHQMDEGYHVDERCISCGICANVCPADNITLQSGHPVFHHQCECCMACIQHCPQRALNYIDKTQKRKRYTHPEITHTEIGKYYESSAL